MPNVNFHDPRFDEIMAAGGKDKEVLDKFLTALALCHNIVIDQETGAYNAASPDELALVNFAKQ